MKCFSVKFGDEISEGIKINPYRNKHEQVVPGNLFLGFGRDGRPVEFRHSLQHPPKVDDNGNGFILHDCVAQAPNNFRTFGVLANPHRTFDKNILAFIDTGFQLAEDDVNGNVFPRSGNPAEISFGVTCPRREDRCKARFSMHLWVLKDGDSVHVQVRGGGHFEVKNAGGTLISEEIDEQDNNMPYSARFAPTMVRSDRNETRTSKTQARGLEAPKVTADEVRVIPNEEAALQEALAVLPEDFQPAD